MRWAASIFAVLIVYTRVTVAWADDKADARALIDKVLQAHGGVEALTKPRAYTFKSQMTAKSKQNPTGVSSVATFYFQPPKQFRMEEEVQRGGGSSKNIAVVNGNRGWSKRGGKTAPVSPQTITGPDEVQQGFGYKFILCVRNSGIVLAPLGESKVDGKTVVGVKLTRPVGRGAEERRLYFDPETHLLVKSDLHPKLSTGSELSTTEQSWEDYKMIDGIAVPHKVTHVIKGREAVTIERLYSDFKFVDKLEADLFKAP